MSDFADQWLVAVKAAGLPVGANRVAPVLAGLGGSGSPFRVSVESLSATLGEKKGGGSAAFKGVRALLDAGLLAQEKSVVKRPATYRLLLSVTAPLTPAAPVAVKAAARPLTPAARRLINDKLDAVYDPETGYVDTWTDKRLAEAIGVPLAWVAEVRELMFGTLKVNPAIEAEAAAAIEVAYRTAKLLTEMKAERGALAELLAEMDRKGARIEADLGAAMATMRRIEEAVRP